MLSSVLNSEQAIQVHISIIRSFFAMRDSIQEEKNWDSSRLKIAINMKGTKNSDFFKQLHYNAAHEDLRDLFNRITSVGMWKLQ